MGFLDRLLGRGKQAMGDISAGRAPDPESMLQQEQQAAEQRATSAPQEAEAKAAREAERRAEGK